MVNTTYQGRRIARVAEITLLVVAALFVLLNALALSFAIWDGVVWDVFRPILIWLLTCGCGWLLLNHFKPNHDPFIFPIFSLLCGWGLLLQRRLAPAFIDRQTMWVVLATALVVVIAVFPRNLSLLRRYRYTILIGGLLLLIFTFIFGVNPVGYGPTLWIQIPLLDIFFQPSELLKLLFVFFFSSYFADRGRLINERHKSGFRAAFPYLAPLILMWGFCVLLLVWQRDLGAASIFFVLFLTMLFTATGQRRYLLIGAVLLILAAVIGYFAYDLIALRIDAWLNPWPDVYGRSFQIVQSLYALAEGGIMGEGVGQGFPTFIPVVHSDFVFAAIAEEWGLIGTLTVVACFALLAQRGYRVALKASTSFRMYLAIGVTTLLSVQALLIMGGVIRLLPLTGVTLPFLSYGGSAMMTAALMPGFLLYLDE